MLFLSLSSSLSFTFNYPILKIWHLHLPVYWYLKFNVANMELFSPAEKSLCSLCSLYLVSKHAITMYSTKNRTFYWPLFLLLPHLTDQVLWVYLWNPSRIHLLLFISMETTIAQEIIIS